MPADTAKPARVCVVGAGVIGLSTALRMCQDLQRSVTVTVLADSFLDETTSHGAAGLWEPYKLGSTPTDLVNTWAEETFHYFRDLYDSSECAPAGISEVPCVALYSQPGYQTPTWRHITPDFRQLSSAELQRHSRTGQCSYLAGHVFTTMFCEGVSYLPWLTRRLLEHGARLQGRKLGSLAELAGEFDVVVNCAGLRGSQLAADSATPCYPIRGHVIRVHAPWVKMAYFSDDTFYVLPNHHNVVLGGTGDIGDWDLAARAGDRDRIWQGCLRMLPSLTKARVERDWVGLRPGRDSVRLEAELIRLSSHSRVQDDDSSIAAQPSSESALSVVHNYGHGGGGITLHWGCAGHAARLVKQLLSQAPVSRL